MEKSEAENFLKNKKFHQNLRNEILFRLIPKTLEPGANQTHDLGHLMERLQNNGMLSQEQGILELLTVKKFYEIIGETPSFEFEQMELIDLLKQGDLTPCGLCVDFYSNK